MLDGFIHRLPNGTYGGVEGQKTKVRRKLSRFPPARFLPPEGKSFSSRGNSFLVKMCIFALPLLNGNNNRFCNDKISSHIFLLPAMHIQC